MADKNFYGEKQVCQDAEGRTADTTVNIQDYKKAGSKDKIAVGQVIISSGQRSECMNSTWSRRKENSIQKSQEIHCR